MRSRWTCPHSRWQKKKTMKALREDSQIDFVLRTSGTRTSHGRLGEGGFVLGFSLSPINMDFYAHKPCKKTFNLNVSVHL